MPAARTSLIVLCCGLGVAFAQPAFEVATVRPSRTNIGHDGDFRTDPGRLIVRNATLKRLIFEAWQIPYSQIAGGPAWLDRDEFDIDAKAEGPAVLAIQLTIPATSSDPSMPSRAAGHPVPVVDETGIKGAVDIAIDLRPDQNTDAFTLWQRALEEQLGLRLESKKAEVPVLVIENAEKVR
jgi:hypothetical protein